VPPALSVHHGSRWVVVKHFLERLIVDDELSTPVSNLVAVDPAHEALENISDRGVDPNLQPLECGARWGIAAAPSRQWGASLILCAMYDFRTRPQGRRSVDRMAQ
jgi:hypothetical protein